MLEREGGWGDFFSFGKFLLLPRAKYGISFFKSRSGHSKFYGVLFEISFMVTNSFHSTTINNVVVILKETYIG